MSTTNAATVSPIIELADSLYQLGYVYPDKTKAVASWTALGAGNWIHLHDPIMGEQVFRGNAVSTHKNLSFGFVGPLNIELVEPISGRCTYNEYLDAVPAGGLHHLGYLVEDFDRKAEALKSYGFGLIQSGRFGEGTRFAYFDSWERFGHYTELLYFDAGTHAMFADLKAGRLA
ncbi:VOC family protein [Xanthomonas arboricola]|uniref:VOC family protein n=1 Tax=Xanthomonas arboricola TaxID=56448 RepID=UPI000698E0E4|nr:VOC family protein [Xanthomonas arboricola]